MMSWNCASRSFAKEGVIGASGWTAKILRSRFSGLNSRPTLEPRGISWKVPGRDEASTIPLIPVSCVIWT